MIERHETSTLGDGKRFILGRGVIPLFFWIVFAATAALAQTVSYDYDRAATFSQYKTYAWTRGSELTDANHERLVRAVDAALVKKGLARVEWTAGPDVLVAYHANFEIEGHELGTQRILVGTLVIDIADARTRKTVWQSRFTSDVRLSASPESRGKRIANATERMFKDYPPKPASPSALARSIDRW